MGYTTPVKTEKLASVHRMLAQGPPNSGKTSAFCRTWPRPAAILVAAGERGDATVPRGETDLMPFIWQEDNPLEKVASSLVISTVETLVFEILGGKHGPFRS